MSNALYLDEICTHLTPQGYLYPLRAPPFGYPGMTDTYDACILFFTPHPVSTCFIIHITSSDDSVLLPHCLTGGFLQ